MLGEGIPDRLNPKSLFKLGEAEPFFILVWKSFIPGADEVKGRAAAFFGELDCFPG